MIARLADGARLFVCAVQFLTRLPTPRLKAWPEDAVTRSAVYYPIVGWIVGGLAALVLLAADRFWPPLVGAALSTVVAVAITGGFHEDGLADAADGLVGGSTRPRRLEIMKDSRIGSYGALALWSVLSLRTLALTALPPDKAGLALVLVHGAARAFPVAVMTLPYAGDPARAKLGADIGERRVRPWQAALAVFLGFAAFALVPLPQACAALALAFAAAAGVGFAGWKLVGGWTGDVLGAIEQVAEAALILGLAASLPS